LPLSDYPEYFNLFSLLPPPEWIVKSCWIRNWVCYLALKGFLCDCDVVLALL
jgi:hypothetical protein